MYEVHRFLFSVEKKNIDSNFYSPARATMLDAEVGVASV